MHSEWVTVDGNGVDYTKDYRIVVEYPVIGQTLSHYEQQVDVRDDDDEPEVDGIYEDRDGDRWLRLNGVWFSQDDNLADGQKWEFSADAYTPYELVPVSDY